MANYDYKGEAFLNRLYRDLNLENAVMHTATHGDKKNEKVIEYLERLHRVEEKVKSKNRISLLKQYYYKKYIIKSENVPESYFELQKKSLDTWLDYLLSDDAMYPEWFKYYVFQGMVKLGNYDKKNDNYNQRTSSTTNIFVDLNREALSLIYDYLYKVLNGQKVNDEILQRLLENDSFSKLYAYTIKKLALSRNNVKDGIWIKYNRGDDPTTLVASLQGQGTGWCEDRVESAMFHLFYGDFYVYYTKDSNGEYKQPRIAIRMVGNKIEEVKGIAKHIEIESEMLEEVVKKLEEFPDREKYLKKVSDMNKITKIYNEYKIRNLTNEELRFLYEIDAKIEGFGNVKDPIINEILKDRNTKKDLAATLNCSEDEISNDIQDVLNGKKIVYFFGDLNLDSLTSIEGVVFPEYIRGDLCLCSLTSAEGSKFPKYIGGDLNLRSLTSAKDVEFPEYIGGKLDLYSLTSVKSSKFPKYIGGDLNLRSLTSAKDVEFPEYIGEKLKLYSLASAEGSKFPKYIGDDLDLSNLIVAKNVVFPEYIRGDLCLCSLTSANGLVLPEYIGGALNMDNLTKAENLIFSKSISGITLSNLISAKNVEFPEYIRGSLNLNSLTMVENSVFPKYITGDLHLNSLTSANGLVLPEYIGEDLNLRNLTSANGIVLPKNINGYLDLSSLTSLDGIIVPRGFKCNQVISSIFTFEDLIAKSMKNVNDISQVESISQRK